jgi:hypothetical protein
MNQSGLLPMIGMLAISACGPKNNTSSASSLDQAAADTLRYPEE